MRIILAGSNGRMGQKIIEESKNFKDIEISPFDKGEQFPDIKADLVIDFSTRESVLNNIKIAVKNGTPFLTGVTGFSAEELEKIKEYSTQIPVLLDFNMSIGINTITSLLNQLKEKLKGYDIEIIETHHRNKVDSPSGTAIKLYNELNSNNEFKQKNGRDGYSPREDNEIGIHAIRVGGVFGEHSVRFGNMLEEVTISHRAFSRATFALGALKAGIWLTKQSSGFYNMSDFLK